MVPASPWAAVILLAVVGLAAGDANGLVFDQHSSVPIMRPERLMIYPFYWMENTSLLIKRIPELDNRTKHGTVQIAWDVENAKIMVDFLLKSWMKQGRKSDMVTFSLFTPRTLDDNATHEIKWAFPLGGKGNKDDKGLIIPSILQDGLPDKRADVYAPYMNHGWTNVPKTIYKLDMELNLVFKIGSNRRPFGNFTWGARMMVHLIGGNQTDEWKCASTDARDQLCPRPKNAGRGGGLGLSMTSIWLMASVVSLVLPLMAFAYWILYRNPRIRISVRAPFVVFYSKNNEGIANVTL